VHGGRGVESRLTVEGLNISNPPGGNQPPNYTADIGNSSEVTVQTAGGLGEFETAGVQMNIVPKQGGNSPERPVRDLRLLEGMQSTTTRPIWQAEARGRRTRRTTCTTSTRRRRPILKDKLW
jgi:hypothetical protein